MQAWTSYRSSSLPLLPRIGVGPGSGRRLRTLLSRLPLTRPRDVRHWAAHQRVPFLCLRHSACVVCLRLIH